MAATSTETNGTHFRVRSILEEERKERPTSAGSGTKRIVLDRSSVAYPDSLSAACSNDDIIRAISLDQLSSRAASRTSITSLSVSQIISECADSDNEGQAPSKAMKDEVVECEFRRLVVEGDDSENEWFGEDEHTQSELHITRADDVVMRETDATIVHVVRKRSIQSGPGNFSSETSGASSNGSDVMVELSDASSTCITVTGDEAIKLGEEPPQTLDRSTDSGNGEDEDAGRWSRDGISDGILVAKKLPEIPGCRDSAHEPSLVPEDAGPQFQPQSPIPATSEGSVHEEGVTEAEGDNNTSVGTHDKDKHQQQGGAWEEETEPTKDEEEDEEEYESDGEGTLGEDEASQSASGSSVIATLGGVNTQEEKPSSSSSSSFSSGSTPVMRKLITSPPVPTEEAVVQNGLPPASKSKDNVETDDVVSTIDLRDLDLQERTGGSAENLLAEEGEQDSTPLLSLKFPSTSTPSSSSSGHAHIKHPLHTQHTVLDGGRGDLMLLQQRLVEMEREQTRMREQMEWERTQWRTANADLQLSLQQLQTKMDEELKRRDAQIKVMEKRLRTAEGRTAGFIPSAKPLERNSSIRRSTRVSPQQADKLRRFFGDNPPLLENFLEDLGYKEYIARFQNEKIGFQELPHLSEWDLINLGLPLGPRLRILHETQLLTSL